MATVHGMEANHQVTGHVILTCPTCKYSVQIDNRTLEKKTLADGDKMTVAHAWGEGGLCIGAQDSKEPFQETEQPSQDVCPACNLLL